MRAAGIRGQRREDGPRLQAHLVAVLLRHRRLQRALFDGPRHRADRGAVAGIAQPFDRLEVAGVAARPRLEPVHERRGRVDGAGRLEVPREVFAGEPGVLAGADRHRERVHRDGGFVQERQGSLGRRGLQLGEPGAGEAQAIDGGRLDGRKAGGAGNGRRRLDGSMVQGGGGGMGMGHGT